MPIKKIDLTTSPGYIIQSCACCEDEHLIKLNRGASETKHGPFQLQVDSTLEVKVDNVAPATLVTFAAGDFPDFNVVTATQLAAKLNASLPGTTTIVAPSAEPEEHGDRATIESDTTGPNSCIEITGGSARAALGFLTDGRADTCPGRPMLGVVIGGVMKNKDSIALRRCCCCDTHEALRRTWDVVAPSYAGTAFYEQRKAVNALAQYLKAQGWVHPDCAAEINGEASTPPDIAIGLPGTILQPPLPRFEEPQPPGIPFGGVP